MFLRTTDGAADGPKRGCAPELAGGGIGPRGGIQHEVRVGIEAVAVQVVREERHAGHAVEVSALEQRVRKIIGGHGGQNRQAAGVVQESSQLPVAE